MVSEGCESSSVIVRTAVAGEPSAPDPATFESVRLIVSFASASVSFVIGTVKLSVVTPSAKTSVPDEAV